MIFGDSEFPWSWCLECIFEPQKTAIMADHHPQPALVQISPMNPPQIELDDPEDAPATPRSLTEIQGGDESLLLPTASGQRVAPLSSSSGGADANAGRASVMNHEESPRRSGSQQMDEDVPIPLADVNPQNGNGGPPAQPPQQAQQVRSLKSSRYTKSPHTDFHT